MADQFEAEQANFVDKEVELEAKPKPTPKSETTHVSSRLKKLSDDAWDSFPGSDNSPSAPNSGEYKPPDSPSVGVVELTAALANETSNKKKPEKGKYSYIEADMVEIACKIYGYDAMKSDDDQESLLDLYLGRWEAGGGNNTTPRLFGLTGLYLYTYMPWFIRNVLTIVFGLQMFEKLPIQMFATIWDDATEEEGTLVPFQGGDAFVIPLLAAYCVPLVALLIISLTYFRGISDAVKQYAKITADAEIVSAAKASLARMQNQGTHGNLLYIVDAASHDLKQVEIGSSAYTNLLASLKKIALHRLGFVKILAVFQLVALLALFAGRFGLVFGDLLATETELFFVCLGLSGFLMKMVSDFMRLQIRATNKSYKAKNKIKYFHLLILLYSFEVAYAVAISMFYYTMTKVYRNWVHVSRASNGVWLGIVESVVYIICGVWIFALDIWFLNKRSKKLRESSRSTSSGTDVTKLDEDSLPTLLSSSMWTRLNADIIDVAKPCMCCKSGDECVCSLSCCRDTMRRSVTGLLNISAAISALATLSLIIDFGSSPVSLYRRAFNETRADEDNWVINFLLIIMFVMWYACMAMHNRLLKITVSHTPSFVFIRIAWALCLVLPFFVYQADRADTKAELSPENEAIATFSQVCTSLVMIFTPILLINLTISFARMMATPLLHLIYGAVIATLAAFILKISALAMIASFGVYSASLGVGLVIHTFLAFAPMSIKIAVENYQQSLKELDMMQKRTSAPMYRNPAKMGRCITENHFCLARTSRYVMTILLIATIVGVITSSIVEDSASKRETIRVGSFNAHLGFDRLFDFDLESMTDKIKSIQEDNYQLDLLCMQEVGSSNWMMGGGDILDYFSKQLNFKYGSYGASQIAPAGFNTLLLSRLPFKKITRYSLPNPDYQSNMVVVELDGPKWLDIDHDVVVMCAHLATGNDKSDQVFTMSDLAQSYTEEGKSVILIGDWNIDVHTRCDIECDNEYETCLDWLNATAEANLREVFWEYVGQDVEELKQYRTNVDVRKLLDFAMINPLVTEIKSALILDYDECVEQCCEVDTDEELEVIEALFANVTDEFCCENRTRDGGETFYVKHTCRFCNEDACGTCSPSDHLPIIFEFGWS